MITIRKATLKDASLIAELFDEFMKYHDEIVIPSDSRLIPHVAKKKNAKSLFKKFAIKNIKSNKSRLNIAEVDGKPAGYSLIYIKDNIPIFTLEKLGYFADLFVKKEFRGMGISSKFKDEAIKWFKKKGMKYASIAVYPQNEHAHSIYKNWGFFDFHVEMRKKI